MTARTRGIEEFTLLLSPDQFDFAKNVKVVVNGRVAFDGRVEKSLETLKKWAARDNNRTMLFGAELKIALDALQVLLRLLELRIELRRLLQLRDRLGFLACLLENQPEPPVRHRGSRGVGLGSCDRYLRA